MIELEWESVYEERCAEEKVILAVLAQACLDCQRPKPQVLLASGRRLNPDEWLKARMEWLNTRNDALEWLLTAPVLNPEPLSAQWCCEAVGWDYKRRQASWRRVYGEPMPHSDTTSLLSA